MIVAEKLTQSLKNYVFKNLKKIGFINFFYMFYFNQSIDFIFKNWDFWDI